MAFVELVDRPLPDLGEDLDGDTDGEA